MKSCRLSMLVALLAGSLALSPAWAESLFNYQGRLLKDNQPYNGTVDLEFRLFDSPEGGTLVAGPLVQFGVPVTDGLFQLDLDFGPAAFRSTPRFLELQIDGSVFASRQAIRPAPMALHAVDAVTLAWQDFFAHLRPLMSGAPLPPDQLLPQHCAQGRSPIRLSLGGEDRRVSAFRVVEAISTLYRVEVLFEEDSRSFPGDWLGAQVSLDWIGVDGPVRRFPGVVTVAAKVGIVAGRAYYALTIEPALARLELDERFRLFQNLTTIEAVQQVLQDAEIDPQQRLAESYPKRDMQVQYSESSLVFIQRRLAREGVWFTFADDGSPVLIDSLDAAEEAGRVAYLGPASPGQHRSGPLLRSLQVSAALAARDFQLIGFRPELEQVTVTQASRSEGVGSVERLDGPFVDLDDQTRATTLGLGVAAQRAAAAGGWSDEPRLRAGYTVSVSDESEHGLDGRYLVTSVEHSGILLDGGEACLFYGNRYQLAPPGIAYLPDGSRWAVQARGPTHGTVTGPLGSSTYTDAFGRIKILFHRDSASPADENASAWLPVMRPFSDRVRTPGVGETVIVDFIDGDPDRPIVIGALSSSGLPQP